MGSRESVSIPSMKECGIIGAAKLAMKNGLYLRTSPDDWWDLIVCRAGSVLGRFTHTQAIKPHRKTSIHLKNISNIMDVTFESLYSAFARAKTENNDIQFFYSINPFSSVMSCVSRGTQHVKRITFDQNKGKKGVLLGVELIGTGRDWQKLRDRANHIVRMIKNFPNWTIFYLSRNQLGEANLKIWKRTKKALDMFDLPMIEGVIDNLVKTLEGTEDMTSWWNEMLKVEEPPKKVESEEEEKSTAGWLVKMMSLHWQTKKGPEKTTIREEVCRHCRT